MSDSVIQFQTNNFLAPESDQISLDCNVWAHWWPLVLVLSVFWRVGDSYQSDCIFSTLGVQTTSWQPFSPPQDPQQIILATANMQRSKTSPCWQVPKNLEERDIQEAFEDIGRVTKCEALNTGHLAFNTDFVLLHADAFAQLILFICRAVVWLFLFVWILSMPGWARSSYYHLCQLLSCQEGTQTFDHITRLLKK